MENLDKLIEIVFDKEREFTKSGVAHITSEEYETHNTLIDIYSNIQNDTKKKDEFIKFLSINLHNPEIIDIIPIGNAHLAAYTLIKLGFSKIVLEELEDTTVASLLIPYTLKELISNETKYFDDDDLIEIKKFDLIQHSILKTYEDYSFSEIIEEYIKNVVDIRFENLKKTVKSVNLEINLDKKVVNDKLSYLGFDPKYSSLLHEVDSYMNSDNSQFVNSAMIGNLRVFIEDIFKNIGRNISVKLNETIPKLENRSEMGNLRNYIKNKLELHENEDKFINNFINILHTEGGHSFTSEKEYFRLARNIAIELHY